MSYSQCARTPVHLPCDSVAIDPRPPSEGARVGSRVEKGSGGRVEGRERKHRLGRGSREGGEVGSRVERGRGGRVDSREREGR
eukprot:1129606-Rhodomonas_salina.5